jgi:predicted DNA-binding transcriptional regulator AlpA
MATLDALLKVAAALPGRSEDLAARTGLNRATIFRVLAELRQAPPDGLGMTIQAPDNEIQDWGILNPARLPGRDAT